MTGRNWGLMQFFNPKGMPEDFQFIYKSFADLALALNDKLPDNSEKSTMLRRLMEARDYAVKAQLFVPKNLTHSDRAIAATDFEALLKRVEVVESAIRKTENETATPAEADVVLGEK